MCINSHAAQRRRVCRIRRLNAEYPHQALQRKGVDTDRCTWFNITRVGKRFDLCINVNTECCQFQWLQENDLLRSLYLDAAGAEFECRRYVANAVENALDRQAIDAEHVRTANAAEAQTRFA